MILEWVDIPTILTLAGLEIVLSADNAVVMAALASSLRPDLQKRALFYGIMGALVLRFLAILSAKWIIQFWFLQIAGGLYLVWLAVQHLTETKNGHKGAAVMTDGERMLGFWKVVLAIELTDLAFAVDSVLAAVGISSKLWVIYSGAVIGLVAMRFAAVGVLGLLKKFPALTVYAYVLVGWIGIKLVSQGSCTQSWGESLHMSVPQFWIVLGLIMLTALVHWLRSRLCDK